MREVGGEILHSVQNDIIGHPKTDSISLTYEGSKIV